ncbi:hypothetical protein QJQ45_026733 [Haematococcus lacustris]|nr:hypothetical protein QJQ45_026733 [Haematococcus lacustris]
MTNPPGYHPTLAVRGIALSLRAASAKSGDSTVGKWVTLTRTALTETAMYCCCCRSVIYFFFLAAGFGISIAISLLVLAGWWVLQQQLLPAGVLSQPASQASPCPLMSPSFPEYRRVKNTAVEYKLPAVFRIALISMFPCVIVLGPGEWLLSEAHAALGDHRSLLARCVHAVLGIASAIEVFAISTPKSIDTGTSLRHASSIGMLIIAGFSLLFAIVASVWTWVVRPPAPGTAKPAPQQMVLVAVLTTSLLVWSAAVRVGSNFEHPELGIDEKLLFPLQVLPEMLQLAIWCVPTLLARVHLSSRWQEWWADSHPGEVSKQPGAQPLAAEEAAKVKAAEVVLDTQLTKHTQHNTKESSTDHRCQKQRTMASIGSFPLGESQAGPAICAAVFFIGAAVCIRHARHTTYRLYAIMGLASIMRGIALSLRAASAKSGDSTVGKSVIYFFFLAAGFGISIAISLLVLAGWWVLQQQLLPAGVLSQPASQASPCPLMSPSFPEYRRVKNTAVEYKLPAVFRIALISMFPCVIVLGPGEWLLSEAHAALGDHMLGIASAIEVFAISTPKSIDTGTSLRHASSIGMLIIAGFSLLFAIVASVWTWVVRPPAPGTAKPAPQQMVLVAVLTTSLLVWSAAVRVGSNFEHPELGTDEKLLFPLQVLPEMLQLAIWCVPTLLARVHLSSRWQEWWADSHPGEVSKQPGAQPLAAEEAAKVKAAEVV